MNYSKSTQIHTGITIYTLVATLLTWIISKNWQSPNFSPDSWSYFELSRSLAEGGYSLNKLRSFNTSGAIDSFGPTTAFPPAWPSLLLMAQKVTQLGPKAGIVLCGMLTFVFLLATEQSMRVFTRIRWLGLCVAFFVIALPAYQQEMLGARTAPLQLALISCSLLVLAGTAARPNVSACCFGILTGTLVMTRFDMIPYALIVLLGFYWISHSVIALLVAFTSAALVASPWVWSSLVYHNKVFASDNSRIAISANKEAFTSDWRGENYVEPTIFTHTTLWIEKVIDNSIQFLFHLAVNPGRWGVTLISVCIVIIVLHRITSRRSITATPSMLFERHRGHRALLILSVAVVGTYPAYIVTGFFDPRYFLLTTTLVLLWLASVLFFHQKNSSASKRQAMFVKTTLLILFSCHCISGFRPSLFPVISSESKFPEVMGFDKLLRCTTRLDPTNTHRILVLDPTLGSQLSAVHHLKTANLPNNFLHRPINSVDILSFFLKFHIGFIAGDPKEVNRIFPTQVYRPVTEDCGPTLFEVETRSLE